MKSFVSNKTDTILGIGPREEVITSYNLALQNGKIDPNGSVEHPEGGMLGLLVQGDEVFTISADTVCWMIADDDESWEMVH